MNAPKRRFSLPPTPAIVLSLLLIVGGIVTLFTAAADYKTDVNSPSYVIDKTYNNVEPSYNYPQRITISGRVVAGEGKVPPSEVSLFVNDIPYPLGATVPTNEAGEFQFPNVIVGPGQRKA